MVELMVPGHEREHRGITSRRFKLAIVRALNAACTAIDAMAYRPAVVRLTLRLPSWWQCQLAHLSMALDARWRTGYWKSENAPAAPDGPCDACGRRAAWLLVGGWGEDEADSAESYLADHTVKLCGWCQLEFDQPPRSHEELQGLLSDAGARSISWRWR
jgi:hypothetical protein